MSQNIQSVVPDDLAERVRRAAEKEGRSVSQWLRLLLERELAEGRCVGCDGPMPGGGEVCQECADLLEAEDADVPHYEATVLKEVPLTPGQKRQAKFTVNPAMPCTHDLAAKRKVSFGFVQDCIKCGAVVRV